MGGYPHRPAPGRPPATAGPWRGWGARPPTAEEGTTRASGKNEHPRPRRGPPKPPQPPPPPPPTPPHPPTPPGIATIVTLVRMAPDEPLHPHALEPSEDIRLSVVEGVVYAAVDELDYVLTPGDRITIPAGDPRRVRNAGDDSAHVILERRPR